MKTEIIYKNGGHQWYFFGRDPNRDARLIDTNQFMITVGNDILLTDPGGAEIFPMVMTSVSNLVDVNRICAIFCSHQDPDIISSLPLWLSLCPKATVYYSWLWEGLMSHYGTQYLKNAKLLPDAGMRIEIGDRPFEIIPAHYLHSAGNFSLFDVEAKILFSGDLGGGFMPHDYPLYVKDFTAHFKLIEPFHKRVMTSNAAKHRWIKRVRKLNPVMICPQHGALFIENGVTEFLDWLEDLEVGRW
ncbi:MAG: MBL fold metallo-hydrolase [Oligoflexia bacterium]|nr:MBL fold metallo-hydrolase [Oligoflexia bacterium]MBF0364162.1 MBL fold metallo-hydrolase [Oligoflexia bacterium]